MSLTKDAVLEALRAVGVPAKKVAACDEWVSVTVACDENAQAREHLRSGVEAAVRRLGAERGSPVREVRVAFVEPGPGDAPAPAPPKPAADRKADIPLKQASSSKTTAKGEAQPANAFARHVVAVGAGKGGVGKSTVSVNLALALARAGRSVGLLDGDIYGPSVPTLMGLEAAPVNLRDNMLEVFNAHGVKTMTIGKLVEPDKPLIWRGPMAHGAFKQLLEQTAWGELDYLIIDLPPGTGDVPLTMSQMLSLSGAVIVCTPQKVAQDDAVRAARMFQQLNIDVLGVVENMSYFVGDDGKEYDIFGRGGAEQMAQRLGLPFLGAVPISMAMREFCDSGQPLRSFTDAGDAIRASLENVAKRVEDEVALAAMRSGSGGPVLSVS